MSLICVPIAVDAPGDVPTALIRARHAVDAGARLIEWRVDPVAGDEDAPAAVVQLVRESPAPCIVTCRDAGEGGVFNGSDEQRVALLTALHQADVWPRYIDIELATWQRAATVRTAMRGLASDSTQDGIPRTSLILSSHDFSGRPRDLMQRVAAMHDEPQANVIKIVWMGRSLRDNLEAFELLRDRQKPMIAIVMGEYGLMSRVLAPKFGGMLTFAVADTNEETAPGQPTITDLRDFYRTESINTSTEVFGVIGWPVAHSQSPAYHNARFAVDGRNAVYLPLPVADDHLHFKASIGTLMDEPSLHFRGASVTIPHKENALRFVRERGGTVDAAADRAGAVNTLSIGASDNLSAINTDAPAIIDALATRREELRGASVALLGAGGVARAAASALCDAGADVTVFNRTPERAHELASHVDGISVGAADGLATHRFDIYVNATSIGMEGGMMPGNNPLDELCEGDPTRPDSTSIVFETVYAPEQTPFLVDAAQRGATCVTGSEMFRLQAERQYEAWQ
ncbi:MAG: type I 3-dehydroquinate dehydratase [Planctomycetota bacterium]